MAQELHGDMIKVTPEFARRVRDAINLAQALAEGPDIDISVIGTHLKRLQDEIDALRARPVVAPVQSYDDEALRQQLGSELGRVDGRLRLLEESALTPYDDSDLRARVEALEARPMAEPAVDITSILERLEALESARAPEPEVIEKIIEVERVVEVQVEDPRVEELQAEIQRMHEEAAKPQPKTLDALTAPGTMVVEDEIKMRRALLTVEIGSYAQDRINARYDANVRAELVRFMTDYSNKKALGLTTTAQEDEASSRANDQYRWITETEAFGRNLIQALPLVSVDVLRAYDLEGAGWP